ncbi:Metallophosphoesterase mpped2 [Tritrichomonas musculus]|uniref:Metallophosphoesterase mpped2 n=1 Tax=Tritrichomonas musculus TaxID=1915356 RepID=A0ABR2GZS5_9EUKA
MAKRWDCILADPSSPRPENSIRVFCFSDTHGAHKKIPKDWICPADIALFAGDFTGVGALRDTLSFIEFFKSLPCKHKVMIAGNHEVTYDTENREDILFRYLQFERGDYSKLVKKYKKLNKDYIPTNSGKKYDDNILNFIKQQIIDDEEIIYLEESTVNIEGLNIYGSPYSPFFYNWAFPTYPNEEKEKGGLAASRWNKIPDDADIVLVHGPPLNILDLVEDDGSNAGDPFLAEKINQINPSLCVFGHIHEAYGAQKIKDTYYANVSTLNFNYEVKNKPLLFDLVKIEKRDCDMD